MTKRFAQINLLALLLFGAGVALDVWMGIPWIRWLAASFFVFFLPGWNASFLLSPRSLSTLERILFGLLTSFPAFALAIYMPHVLFQLPFDGWLIGYAMAALWIGSITAGAIGTRYRPRNRREKIVLWPLLTSIVLYIVLVAAISVIYPFIPEADPYAFIALDKELLRTGEFLQPGYRPLFVTLTSALSVIGNIPLGIIFKYIIPLFGAVMLLPIFLTAQRVMRYPFPIFLATILPLSVPVIMLENVMTRPQVAILFALPGMLYFLSEAIRRRMPWLAGVMVALAFVLIKFHESATIITIPALVALAIAAWPEMKKYPKLAIAFGLLGILAIYPRFISTEAVSVIKPIAMYVIQQISSAPPNLWFLSHYVNFDKIEMGWPGLSVLYYYAYNIGPAIPFLGATYIWSKRKISWHVPRNLWPSIVSTAIFLTIAEILPRFNVGFFPDRAWPFLMISLIIETPYFLRVLEGTFTIWARAAAVTAVLIGIGGALYVTYAKGGWVTAKEYEAAQFLHNHTPEGSAIISQGGNGPLITFYADRSFVHVDVFSPSISLDQRLAIIQTTSEPFRNREELEREKRNVAERLAHNVSQLRVGKVGVFSLEAEWRTLLPRLLIIEQDLGRIDRLGLDQPRPVYILYSHDKFSSLYRIRSWWRNLNYENADLSNFADERYFEIVFDNGPVQVWRAKDQVSTRW